jgi:hypothetical protein
MADAPREPTRTTPRWVKVFVIVTIIVVVLGVVIFLVSGGQHGPGRHLPGGGSGETPPPGVTEDGGHTPPPGIDHGG